MAVLGTRCATVTSLAMNCVWHPLSWIKVWCDPRRERPAQYWTCSYPRAWQRVCGEEREGARRRGGAEDELLAVGKGAGAGGNGATDETRMKHGLGIRGMERRDRLEQEAVEESEGKKGRQRGTNPGGYPDGNHWTKGRVFRDPVRIFVSPAKWYAISSGRLAGGPRRGLRSGSGRISSCGSAPSTSSRLYLSPCT